MNRSSPPTFVAVLMLIAVSPSGAAVAGPQAQEAEPSVAPAPQLAIVVEVENEARMSPADLAAMEEVVSRTYRAIGVGVIWVYGYGGVSPQDPRRLRAHLRLLSRTTADRKIVTDRIDPGVLGRANRPARIVYIFCHRVGEASRKYGHEYTRVLGFVAAHELGHVLLPAYSHSETGIMKGSANLRARTVHEFTPEEGEAIRAGLLGERRRRAEALRLPQPH